MDPIYLDYAATTPVREEVRAAMAPYLCEAFGNPSSIHRWGRVAEEALESARARAARAIGAEPAEIFFVRGGTESDNLAIQGWLRAQIHAAADPTVGVSAIEHHAVLEAATQAHEEGRSRLLKLPVGPDGRLDLDAARRGVGEGPALLSVMWVNNETGMTLPLTEVTDLARETGAVVHSDAAQALGKVPVDVEEVRVDLLSATGHKIYGPKGAGILFVRTGTELAPVLHGGGQEGGLRPGTEDVAGAVGLATAMQLAVEERAAEAERLEALRTKMEAALTAGLDGLRINAGRAPRAPHVLSVGVDGVRDGHALLVALDLEGVAVSGGSACLSGATKASHVIAALYGPDDGHATVRFSFGRASDAADVSRAVEATVAVVRRARAAA